MDQDTSNSSGKASWREKLGIAPAGAKDLPKIADEFKGQKPDQPGPPRLVAVREPKPVIKPAPMAPRAANGNGAKPHQPAPQPVATNQTLGERLRAEREAAEKLARQRIAQARGRGADEAAAEPAKPQANSKPKFSFADDEIQQAKREVASGRDFPGLPSRSSQTQPPPPLIPPRPVLGGGAAMPPPANRASIFQPRLNAASQAPAGNYRPLDPPAGLAKPASQREPVAISPQRQPAAMPRVEPQHVYGDVPRRPPLREGFDPYRRRPPQPTQAYADGNGYFDDARRRPAPHARGRQPAYEDDMGEVFEDDPRPPQQQHPRRKANAQDYNQVYREYEGGYDEPRRRSRSSGPWLLLSILLAGVLLSGGILYYYLNYMNRPGAAQSGVPVIAAPEQPAKAEPLLPDATDLSAKGSAQQPVESKRKQIYDRILGDEEVGGNQLVPTEEQPQIVEPAGGQSGQPQPGSSNEAGPDSDAEPLPLPLPPPGDQGSIGTNSNQQVAALGQTGKVETEQVAEPASAEDSISGNSVPPIPEADQATSLDSAMVPGEQAPQQPASSAEQPAQVQEPAFTEPEPAPKPVVEEVEPAPAKKVRAEKKAPVKKQVVETVEPIEPAEDSALGPEPLVLVPPAQSVAANATEQPAEQSVEQPTEQKSRSFFDFGKSSGKTKLTGKGAERVAGLEPTETVIKSNYANARQPKTGEDTLASDQLASLAAEPEAEAIPEPVPESKPQPQQAAISGYIAQLASFRSEAEALAEYDRLLSRHGGLLSGLSPRVTKATVSGSSRYRLGVGPLANRSAASKLCSNLIAAGERDCLVRSN